MIGSQFQIGMILTMKNFHYKQYVFFNLKVSINIE